MFHDNHSQCLSSTRLRNCDLVNNDDDMILLITMRMMMKMLMRTMMMTNDHNNHSSDNNKTIIGTFFGAFPSFKTLLNHKYVYIVHMKYGSQSILSKR